jgi:tetratricopeptide (TPR) repeat protein
MSGRKVLVVSLFILIGQTPLHAQQREEGRLEYVRRLLVEGRYQEVADTLGRVDPDSLSPAALFTMGTASSALGDLQRALRYYGLASERDPSSLLYLLQRARVLSDAGMVLPARRAYESALTIDSASLPALLGLGRLHFDQRRFAASAPYFARAVQATPRDFLANYYLGASLFNLDLPDSALPFLAVAQTLNPAYVPAIALLGSIHFDRKDYGGALRLYKKAAAQQPDFADLAYRTGQCLYQLHDLEDAKSWFLQASHLEEANVSYLSSLGQTYYALGRFDSAAFAFEEATEVDKENPTLFLNLGLALARMDSVRAALASLKKAVMRYGPENIARVYDEMGALYFGKERYTEALRAYRRALVFDPRNITASFYLAFTLDQLRDYRSAVKAYRHYLSLAADDPSQQRNLRVARERLKLLPP